MAVRVEVQVRLLYAIVLLGMTNAYRDRLSWARVEVLLTSQCPSSSLESEQTDMLGRSVCDGLDQPRPVHSNCPMGLSAELSWPVLDMIWLFAITQFQLDHDHFLTSLSIVSNRYLLDYIYFTPPLARYMQLITILAHAYRNCSPSIRAANV